MSIVVPLPKGTPGRFRLTEPCPKCGAEPNELCRGRDGGPRKALHTERKIQSHFVAGDEFRCLATTGKGHQCVRASELRITGNIYIRLRGHYCRQHARKLGQIWTRQRQISQKEGEDPGLFDPWLPERQLG